MQKVPDGPGLRSQPATSEAEVVAADSPWVLSPVGKELIGGTRQGWLCQGLGMVWGGTAHQAVEPWLWGRHREKRLRGSELKN